MSRVQNLERKLRTAHHLAAIVVIGIAADMGPFILCGACLALGFGNLIILLAEDRRDRKQWIGYADQLVRRAQQQ